MNLYFFLIKKIVIFNKWYIIGFPVKEQTKTYGKYSGNIGAIFNFYIDMHEAINNYLTLVCLSVKINSIQFINVLFVNSYKETLLKRTHLTTP